MSSLSYSSVMRPPYWTTDTIYLIISQAGVGALFASISRRWFYTFTLKYLEMTNTMPYHCRGAVSNSARRIFIGLVQGGRKSKSGMYMFTLSQCLINTYLQELNGC